MVARFEVYLINLDEETSSDPKNTRPAVIVSPDELNPHVETVIIAPISSTNARYPTRVPINFLNDERYVILDQIRAIEKGRLVKKIGDLEKSAQSAVADKLTELFAP